MQTLAQALAMQAAPEATRFWQNVVEPYKGLNPIRQTTAFRQLAAQYSAAQAKLLKPTGEPGGVRPMSQPLDVQNKSAGTR